MRLGDLEILRCPPCGSRLEVSSGKLRHGELPEGVLGCTFCSARFPVTRSIPRFLPAAKKTSYDIGFAEYHSIQLDSANGTTIARRRLAQLLPAAVSDPSGMRLLEVGCGSGRYTEHTVTTDADLWAVDLSESALEACRRNFKEARRLHLIQGDIYHLPFAPDAFDLVYSLGLLMAVPSPLGAVQSLQRHVKPGGWLIVDIYRWTPRHLLNPRTWLRPLTSRLPVEWLWRACGLAVPILWPISRMLGRVPGIGRHLRSLVLISNYDGILPLSDEAHKQFALLDTFDALAATYSHCVPEKRLRAWLMMAGLSEIEIFPEGMMAARARKQAGANYGSVGNRPRKSGVEAACNQSAAAGC